MGPNNAYLWAGHMDYQPSGLNHHRRAATTHIHLCVIELPHDAVRTPVKGNNSEVNEEAFGKKTMSTANQSECAYIMDLGNLLVTIFESGGLRSRS